MFGPRKTRCHKVVRKHTCENPGSPIGMENFAEKLKEAFLLFYKPLTVINSFKSSGIYPVDGNAISDDQLTSGLTFAEMIPDNPVTTIGVPDDQSESSKQEEKLDSKKVGEEERMKIAFEAYQSVLNTPVREKYGRRIQEGYGVEGKSSGFDAYQKLYKKSHPLSNLSVAPHPEIPSGLELLASVAASSKNQSDVEECCASTSDNVSPVLKDMLTFPYVQDSNKKKRRVSVQSILPDNLTSLKSLRLMALKDLAKVSSFAEKQKRPKLYF